MSEIMQKISDHCGITAALKLSGVYGGRTMYVPEKWSKNHRLARLIGADELAELILLYGGTTVDVAHLQELHRYRQVGTVLRMRDQPVSRIAARTQLSQNWVKSLLTEYAYLLERPRRRAAGQPQEVMAQLEMWPKDDRDITANLDTQLDDFTLGASGTVSKPKATRKTKTVKPKQRKTHG